MTYSELLNPLYVYRKRHRIIPFIVDELGGKLRCHSAAMGLTLSDNERRLASLENRHQGKRAFVIGTGPSLKAEDLDQLKGEITFASNKIFLAFDKTDWRPTYYLAEDSLSIEATRPYFHTLAKVTKLFPFRRKQLVKTMGNTIFFNLVWRPFYPKMPQFQQNALRYMVWGGTVTYTLIQLAIYTGVREIYLLGIDFNYPQHQNIPPHGDSAFEVNAGSHGHFHPNYYGQGEKIYPPNIHLQEQAYLAAVHHAQMLGVSIYNATRGGKLEIFPRVDFDSVISGLN